MTKDWSLVRLAVILMMTQSLAGGAEMSVEDRFRTSVWPLLEDSCVGCHGPDKQKGDLRLDSREAALKGGKSGAAFVPGKPTESLMIQLTRHEDQDRPMPPKEELTAAQIKIIEDWIAAGAPWPARAASPASEPDVRRLGDAWHDPENPVVRAFGGKRLDLWSLKPLSQTSPPEVGNASWVINPIDAYVLAKMEANHLRPAPDANRRTLARRLYFDLTGLPPTPEEMSVFMSDESPDAYSKLVDHLLDSEAYGEHWARLWLDVVRYGDSNGFDWDEFRPVAWRFRDYVIRSLNQDKPFDRFIREQLAGDEMFDGAPRTEAERDALIATGYLRIGPFDNSAKKFGEYLQCRTQVLTDLVETTASALLGLNLSCARCHNHKMDPVTQADFYRLRAFFEGVQARDELPLNLADEQDAISKHNEVLDRDIAAKSKELSGITLPVYTRVRNARIARLSEYDQNLLRLSYDASPPNIRDQIRAVEKTVRPRDSEINEGLSKAERERRDALEMEISLLEKRRQNFDYGLLATDDGPVPPETRILYQGDCLQPREPVLPGVPSVFDPNPSQIKPPVRKTSSGRRTILAEWIASRQNPLTARVFVNRVWQAHFGQGIVSTANDFGFAGARPTHPELLDWLSGTFMEQGWSLKKLHRLMVMSNTYQQGLGAGDSASGHLFVGHPPLRLDAEQLRDSMLVTSGSLHLREGGPPLWPKLPADVEKSYPSLLDYEAPLKQWQHTPEEETYVRSIYLVQKRSVRLPIMETFDLPENGASCPRRTSSIVAPQALALLNNEFPVDMAKCFARRIARETGSDESKRIVRAYQLALQREPDSAEQERCVRFLEHHNFTELCRALMNLNEFIFVD